MAYDFDFDALRCDICELTAWMLSYSGADNMPQDGILLKNMRHVHGRRISRLLLSVVAHLRIVRDMSKDKSVASEKNLVGVVLTDDGGDDFTVCGWGEDIFFRDVLDRVLHATISVEKYREISSEGTTFKISLSGRGKSNREEWLLELDIIKFCSAALEFIDQKKAVIKFSN